MKKYITVSKETRRALTRKYGVTQRALFDALSFKTKNDRGRNIRKDALEMGGVYQEEGWKPNCKVNVDNIGYITCEFPNNVTVVARTKVVDSHELRNAFNRSKNIYEND